MSTMDEFCTIISLPSFDRATKSLLSDADRDRLEFELATNPDAGVVIAGTGGVRKYRFALPGRGKSAGLRVIYYVRNSKGRVYLITGYTHATQHNVTQQQKHAMRQLTAILDREP